MITIAGKRKRSIHNILETHTSSSQQQKIHANTRKHTQKPLMLLSHLSHLHFRELCDEGRPVRRADCRAVGSATASAGQLQLVLDELLATRQLCGALWWR